MKTENRTEPNVTRNMVLGFLAVALVIAFSGGLSYFRGQDRLEHHEAYHEQAFASVLKISQLASETTRGLFAGLVLQDEGGLTDYQAGREQVAAELVRYASLAHLTDHHRETQLANYSRFQAAWSRFVAQADQAAARQQQSITLTQDQMQGLNSLMNLMFRELDNLLGEEQASFAQHQEATRSLVRESGIWLLMVVTAGLATLGIIGWLLIRNTSRIVSDISERDADLELRSAAMDATHVGICYTDARRDHVVVYVNDALCDMTGYSRAELLDRNCRMLQGEETDPEAVRELREAVTAGQSASVVMRNYRKDGSPFWNELFVSPVRDRAGNLTHFVGAMHDVSERLELMSQLTRSQKMEAVGQLAGGVAHDFNNYLTVILGNAEVLLQDLDGKRLRERAEQIIEAGNRSAELTRQLLAFSKRQVLVPKVLDLNRVLLDMDPLLRRTLGERVNLETMTAGGLGQVSADRSQIEQVLLNLVVNARDAMPDGGRITVETGNVYLDEEYAARAQGVQEGRYVMLAVSDTGCGIPESVRDHIFEPFFSTKESGGGLGLSTVLGVVEQSGGSVKVYSEPGEGTTFKVYLPRVSGGQEPPRSLTPPDARHISGRVLVVEDQDMVREITAQMLRSLGMEVVEAQTGDQGLELLIQEAGRIDLLLTDVMLPGMSGRELADEAIARFPGMAILYMSGYTENGIAHHGRLDDGVTLLEKPFSIDQLRRKLVNVLHKSR